MPDVLLFSSTFRLEEGERRVVCRDFFCAKPKNPDLKFGKPRQPNFQKTQFSAIKPSSNFSKTHLFRKFSKKITKFWLKSGQFWLIWQNSVQNFRKPSSKNAKTQFSRKVKSVNSVRHAQKKALIQCGSFVWNPPTLSFFHVKIFTKRLCRPFLQPKNYRKMISYHTKVTRPLFDERLKKNLRYFP